MQSISIRSWTHQRDKSQGPRHTGMHMFLVGAGVGINRTTYVVHSRALHSLHLHILKNTVVSTTMNYSFAADCEPALCACRSKRSWAARSISLQNASLGISVRDVIVYCK